MYETSCGATWDLTHLSLDSVFVWPEGHSFQNKIWCLQSEKNEHSSPL